jgi:hypothetical protein
MHYARAKQRRAQQNKKSIHHLLQHNYTINIKHFAGHSHTSHEFDAMFFYKSLYESVHSEQV